MIWVECHTAFQDFEDLYEPLLLHLQTIVQNKGRKKWDAKSRKGLFPLQPPTLPSIFLDSQLYLHVASHSRVQQWMLLRLTSMLKL